MKLAISISGETRLYNNEHNLQQFHVALDKLFGKYEYDLYGHTWNRCEVPKDITSYTVFEQTDDNEIWEQLVKPNFFDFVPYRDEWQQLLEYQCIDDEPEKFIEFCKETSIGAYAQIWSWDKTIKQIFPRISEYDGVVRWRWDSNIEEGDELIDQKIFLAQEQIYNFLTKRESYDSQQYTGHNHVLTECPNNLHSNTMQDTFFIVDRMGVINMNRQPILKSLSDAISNSLPLRYTAHELWWQYLEAVNCPAIAGLPQVRGSCRQNTFERPNKNYWI